MRDFEADPLSDRLTSVGRPAIAVVAVHGVADQAPNASAKAIASSDVTLAFGISVVPFFSVPNVLAGLAQRLRLRLGLRLDAKHWEPSLRRLEIGSTMYVR